MSGRFDILKTTFTSNPSNAGYSNYDYTNSGETSIDTNGKIEKAVIAYNRLKKEANKIVADLTERTKTLALEGKEQAVLQLKQFEKKFLEVIISDGDPRVCLIERVNEEGKTINEIGSKEMGTGEFLVRGGSNLIDASRFLLRLSGAGSAMDAGVSAGTHILKNIVGDIFEDLIDP